ncbi:MAG TPA: PAS domain S-box protein [Anaerolineales bacterium]|nr:PAS domain S-box protein [Anaerolineales bacterium]
MKKSQLNQHESLYQTIFDAMADGIIIKDASTDLIVRSNPSVAKMHGYTHEEFIGSPLTKFIHSDDHHLLALYAETVQAGRTFEALVVHVRQDGSLFNAEWRGTAFAYQDQPYWLCAIRDVSERVEEDVIRRMVQERTHEQTALLEISEAFASALEVKPSFILEQFRGIIEYTHAGLFAVEESNLIVLTTHNPRELEQAPPLNIQLDVPETLTALFTRQRPIRIADVRGEDPAAKFLRSFLSNEAAAMLREAKSWMWVPLAVKGRVIAVIGLAHSEQDYFKARHADMAMTLANQAAISLVNAELVEDAQSLAILQERQRLARNLHDAVNQSLFSAGLIAEVLPSLWEEDQEDARRSLEDLRNLTRGAIAEMRMLVSELRPLALIDSNLSDLLHQLADAFTGRTNIHVALTITGEDILSSNVQVVVYRICQEALNNIAKHAAASRVKIKLQYTVGKVDMHIQDNGRGFDSNLLVPGHYGLSMMNERAETVGAQLEIMSRPGKGTVIIFRWQETSKQEST